MPARRKWCEWGLDERKERKWKNSFGASRAMVSLEGVRQLVPLIASLLGSQELRDEIRSRPCFDASSDGRGAVRGG